jgi:hypothetical protein
MTARDAYAVGARLLAVLFFVFAVASVASVPATFEAMRDNHHVSSPWAYVLGPLAGAVIYLLASGLLWFRNPIAAADAPGTPAGRELYILALSLMGVYLAATGLPGLVEALIEAALWESSIALAAGKVISEMLLIAIGVLLTTRARQLSRALAPA